ncbi:MAG: recombinase family protein [Rhodobacteraceae bacterium]|nr:recombinase family protein [Paracoccaceae bacterium]
MSTQKQGEGVSLQEQKDAIEVFASRQDLEVTQWFEEKETAAKSGRPVFNKMLRDLKRGMATGLIIHKIDRSARNLKDWAIVSELPDHGIQVYVATETIDFNSRGGRLTADMLAVIATDFIRNLREECRKGMRGRLKQGLYPFRAPIGYLDNGRGQSKTPCPQKAPLIREFFNLYASGQHSLRSLQTEMNQRGLRNHGGRPVSLHGIETILNNPFYTGLIEIKRTGETYKGIHKPIISTSLFRRVQNIKLGRSGPKVTKHNHLFRGLFRCGLCDRPMSPELQKGRVYYRCQAQLCETKTIREDILSDHISSELLKLEISDEDAANMIRKWDSGYSLSSNDDLRKSLQLRISATEQGLSRAADLLIDGTLDNETYLAKKHDANLTLASLQEEIRNLPDPKEIESNNLKFIELMKNLTGLYESLNPAEKRMFVENTFSNRTVIGRKPCVEPYSWVTHAQDTLCVPSGEPDRHRDRTKIVSDDILALRRVLKLKEDSSQRNDEAA